MATAGDRFVRTLLETLGLIVVVAVVIATQVNFWRRNGIIRGLVDLGPRRGNRQRTGS